MLHSTENSYTCHSKTFRSLSRIDLVLCSADLVISFKDVVIEPRGIFDHSHVTFTMVFGRSRSNIPCRLNSFWLDLFPQDEALLDNLGMFITQNTGSASTRIVWYAPKAYLRGLLIKQVALKHPCVKSLNRSRGRR